MCNGCTTVVYEQKLMPKQVKDAPHVMWEAERGAYYTLLMVGHDEPERDNPIYRDTRIWLVMNIFESDVDSGEDVAEYMGICPGKDSGIMRYMFSVYKQPNGWINQNEPISLKW